MCQERLGDEDTSQTNNGEKRMGKAERVNGRAWRIGLCRWLEIVLVPEIGSL